MRIGGTTARIADGGLPRATRPSGLPAAEFVHDYLKDLILDLVIAPDTLITEPDVSEATGLSRTPIREALRRLHEERLVEVSPRRGAVVAGLGARQVRELYDVRLLIESHAAELLCADRVPVSHRLDPLCDLQEERYEADASAAELIRIDRRFHTELIAAAGNTVMSVLNESLGDHHQRTGVLSFTLDRTRCRQAIDQHRAISQGLAAHDLDATRAALQEHLVVGERQIERLLQG